MITSLPDQGFLRSHLICLPDQGYVICECADRSIESVDFGLLTAGCLFAASRFKSHHSLGWHFCDSVDTRVSVHTFLYIFHFCDPLGTRVVVHGPPECLSMGIKSGQKWIYRVFHCVLISMPPSCGDSPPPSLPPLPPSVGASLARARTQIITSLLGRHNVYNVLAAVATGIALRVPLKDIVAGIEAVELVPGRCVYLHVGV